ncbi:hypothetical protein ABZ628_27795 [Streptomyces diastaticus]|uniref:DUF6197 family protein n=1 Tax=Streptomyces diastaticus TaxID=1956 RepID=UPI0033EBD5BD
MLAQLIRKTSTALAVPGSRTVATPTPSMTPRLLIERAWDLEYCADWLYWGPSGMPMTGDQIAAHAEAAATLLRTEGWNPHGGFTDAPGHSIYSALVRAIEMDTDQRFGIDTRVALRRIFELLIRALTGAPSAFYLDWDKHPTRTVEEVLGLLATAAAFARTHGKP